MKPLKWIIGCMGAYLMVSCSLFEKGDMPSFTIRLKDSTTLLKSETIPTGNPIMFVYFSPDCEHCQKQTEEMLQHINRLKKVNIYFITEEPMDRIRVFHKYYRLVNYPNIILGRDDEFSFYKHYELPTTPCTILYNKNKKLKAVLKGEFPIKDILEQIDKL